MDWEIGRFGLGWKQICLAMAIKNVWRTFGRLSGPSANLDWEVGKPSPSLPGSQSKFTEGLDSLPWHTFANLSRFSVNLDLEVGKRGLVETQIVQFYQ